jgi:hypothetical protein
MIQDMYQNCYLCSPRDYVEKAPNYNQLVNKVILYLSYSPISFHDVLKWAEEIFLETKVGKFTLLDELHRQLT